MTTLTTGQWQILVSSFVWELCVFKLDSKIFLKAATHIFRQHGAKQEPVQDNLYNWLDRTHSLSEHQFEYAKYTFA